MPHLPSPRALIHRASVIVALSAASLAATTAPALAVSAAPIVTFEDQATGPDRVTASLYRYGATQAEPLRLQVVRGGAVLGSADGPTDLVPDLRYASVAVSVELSGGDVARIVGQNSGKTYLDIPYDDRPRLITPLCIGSGEADGTQPAGSRTYWLGVRDGKEGSTYTGTRYQRSLRATVVPPTGEKFNVVFKKPLVAGQYVTARARRTVGETTVFTDIDRPVGTCVITVPPQMLDAVKWKLTATKLARRATLKTLTSKGIRFQVTTPAAGKLITDLVVRWTERTGKKRTKTARTFRAARLTAQVQPGTTKLTLKVPAKRLEALRRALAKKGAKLVLDGTLTPTSGQPASDVEAKIKPPRR